MLQGSFVHLPGIGPSTERKLWAKGIRRWEDLAGTVSGPRADLIRRELERSHEAYQSRDLAYFYRALPRDQLWRLIPEASDRIAYLDIETTGMGVPPSCHSTTITFFFRGQVMQAHEHSEKRALIERVLEECSMLATFFGESFDLPFLRQEFDLPIDTPHIDLCFWLRRQGYRGGLKRVQKMFPDIPARLSLDIDGFDAVRLWRLHRQGVEGALETLLTYNAEDTVVLEPLLIKAYNRELEAHPDLRAAGAEPLVERPMAELTTRVFPSVYALLRGVGA